MLGFPPAQNIFWLLSAEKVIVKLVKQVDVSLPSSLRTSFLPAPTSKQQTSNWHSCYFSSSRKSGTKETPRGSDFANALTKNSRSVHFNVLRFWKPIVEETFVVMGPSYGREFDLSYNRQSSITLSISNATLWHSLYKCASGSQEWKSTQLSVSGSTTRVFTRITLMVIQSLPLVLSP